MTFNLSMSIYRLSSVSIYTTETFVQVQFEQKDQVKSLNSKKARKEKKRHTDKRFMMNKL